MSRLALKLREKVVWVVGASSGIGYEGAKALADRGNFVIVSARTRKPLAELALKYGQQIKVVECDVVNEDSVLAAINSISDATHYLDCVVNCVGICEYQDTLKIDTDMYKRTFDVNVISQINVFKHAAHLLESSPNQPVYAALGSLVTLLPFPRAEAYGASKAALEYWVKSMQADLGEHKIRMCLLRPGFVETPLTEQNDFDMPFMLGAHESALRVISGIESGKLVADFPRRFSYILKLMSCFKTLWYKKVAPAMSRVNSGAIQNIKAKS